jgi:HlyD family secretion protein
MKKQLLLSVVGLAVLTASVAAFYQSARDGETPQYMTVAATRGDVIDTVEATGTLEAVTTVQVGSQVSGTIKSLHADFNSQVRKGQVIARLDPSLLQAQVDQAQATIVRLQADVERARVALDDAQVKLRRARELFAAQLIPAIDVENAESTARQAEASVKAAQAQVTQARASLSQNQVNLSHTVITAPVDGIVISRNVDVGQTVAASMSAPTLFVIAKDLSQMQVNASVDEADIGRIKPGQAVEFRVDAFPRETFTGTVSQVRLQPVVSQNVVSYVTVISVPNEALKLKPGMTANVTVEIARADDVLRVANGALRFQPPTVAALPPAQTGQTADTAVRARGEGGRGPRVWVLRDGQPQPVGVQTGLSDDTTTAIIGGELAEGAQVITGVKPTDAAATTSTASPLIPQRPGGNRQQGARGGTR